MPEGDTIFRTACTLQRALPGQPVTRFETVLPKLAIDYDTPIAGRTVDSVEAAKASPAAAAPPPSVPKNTPPTPESASGVLNRFGGGGRNTPQTRD